MTNNAYVFIDGNNFYHNVKKLIKPSYVDFFKLTEFICSYYECKHKKTIYYNSVPSVSDGEKMYYDHMRFLDEIRKIAKFEVKTRKLQRSSTKETQQMKKETIEVLEFCGNCMPLAKAMCSDCIGNVKKREKGMDVMIAIDMLNLCLIEKKCDFCILVSGDSDFVPSLDLIKRSKKKVATAFVPPGYSYLLRKSHRFFIIDRNKLIENCLKSSKATI